MKKIEIHTFRFSYAVNAKSALFGISLKSCSRLESVADHLRAPLNLVDFHDHIRIIHCENKCRGYGILHGAVTAPFVKAFSPQQLDGLPIEFNDLPQDLNDMPQDVGEPTFG